MASPQVVLTSIQFDPQAPSQDYLVCDVAAQPLAKDLDLEWQITTSARDTHQKDIFSEYLEEAAFDFSGDFDRSGVEPRGLEGHADRISAFPYPFQDVPRITLGCPVDQFSPTSISSGEFSLDDDGLSPYQEISSRFDLPGDSPSTSLSSIAEDIADWTIRDFSPFPWTPKSLPSIFRTQTSMAAEPTVAPSQVWSDPTVRYQCRSAPARVAALPVHDRDTRDQNRIELEDVTIGLRSPPALVSFDLPEATADDDIRNGTGGSEASSVLFGKLSRPVSFSLSGLSSAPGIITPPSTTGVLSYTHSNKDSLEIPVLRCEAAVERHGSARKRKPTSHIDAPSPKRPSPHQELESLAWLPSSIAGPSETQGTPGRSSDRPRRCTNTSTKVLDGNEWTPKIATKSPRAILSRSESHDIGRNSSTPDVYGNASIKTHPAQERQGESSKSQYKRVIASTAILRASGARRKTVAKYICQSPGCSSTFTTKHNLKHHGDAHDSIKRFSCDRVGCGKRFRTSGVLKRHKILHENPKK